MGQIGTGRGVTWREAWALAHSTQNADLRGIGEEVFFGAALTPGVANLDGQLAFSAAGTLTPAITKAVTGSAVTATAGTLTPSVFTGFLRALFNGTNSTSITAYTSDVGGGWSTVYADGGLPTLQSGRLHAANTAVGSSLVVSAATPSSANYTVTANMYFSQFSAGGTAGFITEGLAVRASSVGGGAGYIFGWDDIGGQWQLDKMVDGLSNPCDTNAVDDLSRSVGQTREFKVQVTGSNPVVVTCSVNDVVVIEFSDDTADRITAAGSVGVYTGLDYNSWDWADIEADGAVGITQPLTGASVTATAGSLVFYTPFVHDTFTGANGTTLASHPGEIGADWTLADSSGGATIALQGGEAQPTTTSGYTYYRASGIPYNADYDVWAYHNYIGPGTVYADVINIGIVARMNAAGTAGYVFGPDYASSSWEIRKIGTAGALASVYQGTGTGVDGLLRLRVTGTNPTTIKGFVNEVEVLSVTDSTSPVTDKGYVGQHSYTYLTPVGTLDNLGAACIGGEFSAPLTGQSATATAGTLTGALAGSLTHAAVTATAGTLGVHITVGSSSTTAAVVAPVAAATVIDPPPETMVYTSAAFVSFDGVIYGAGEKLAYDSTDNHHRRGITEVSQRTQDTLPWTEDGTTVDFDVDALDLDMYLNSAGYKQFPRYGNVTTLVYVYPIGYISVPVDTYRFNDAPSAMRGWVSVAKDGAVQSMHARAYVGAGNAFVSEYLSWEQGGYAAGAYAGPEIHLGTITYETYSLPSHQRGALGFYALGSNRALALYQRPHDAAVSASVGALVGAQVAATAGTLTASFVGDVVLTGQSATARAGTLTAAGGTTYVALTGQHVTATAGTVYADNSQVNSVVAYRKLQAGVWGSEVALASFSGAAHCWPIAGTACVTHSGYGDILYVTYLSAERADSAVPAYVGLVVVDTSTDTVHSHVLTALTDTPAQYWRANAKNGVPHDRMQGEVVALSNGTSVTQYLCRQHVLRLAWTYATRTAPTLTLKDGPNSGAQGATTNPVIGWESLEIRGDSVYHVLYGSATTLHVNDATSTSETWTTVTATKTGSDITSDTALFDFYSGYGSGLKTWLYRVNWHPVIPDYAYHTATYWLDFWAEAPPLLSVAAQGAVGQVAISAVPYSPLTNAAATATAGTLTPSTGVTLGHLAATATAGTLTGETPTGDRTGELTGAGATATAGTLTPNSSSTALSVPLTGAYVTAVTFGLFIIEGRLTNASTITYAGTLEPSSSVTVALTGAGCTAAAGTLGVAHEKALTGAAAGTSSGGVQPTTITTMTGAGVGTAAGTLGPALTKGLTGSASTGGTGALGTLVENAQGLGHGVVTAAAGTLTPVISVVLSNSTAGSAAGTVTPLLGVTLTGQIAVSQAGTLGLLYNIFLTGAQGLLVQGDLGVSVGGSVTVTGVSCRGEVADVTQGWVQPRAEWMVWAQAPSVEVTVQQRPVETTYLS